MGFETFLVLLPSGAGGHVPDADKARAMADDLNLQGWILGCRFGGHVSERPGMGKQIRKVVKVTLLWTRGEPDLQAMTAALATAGQRHVVEYRLKDGAGPTALPHRVQAADGAC